MAVCPLGLNQICHLTARRLVTVSEAKDSKATIYHTTAVLSPNEPPKKELVEYTVESARSLIPSEPEEEDLIADGTCSMAALARHGKKCVVVALNGQIWFIELTGHPSSEVRSARVYFTSLDCNLDLNR